MRDFNLDNIDGICEASSFERQCLWDKFHNTHKYSWIQCLSGIGKSVGRSKRNKTFVALNTAEVNGKKILFWHATSQVVNYRLIDKWIEKNFKGVPKTDAQNFINIIK